jgi:hypothetical protein
MWVLNLLDRKKNPSSQKLSLKTRTVKSLAAISDLQRVLLSIKFVVVATSFLGFFCDL